MELIINLRFRKRFQTNIWNKTIKGIKSMKFWLHSNPSHNERNKISAIIRVK